MGVPRTYTDSDFSAAVSGARSIGDVLRILGLKPAGGNYKSAHNRIALLGLDTSHFSGKSWRKGTATPVLIAQPLASIMRQDSSYNSNRLKKRLIAEGIKQHQCEGCGRREWQSRTIPLELDHINGDNRDHTLSNLRLLCPNCHALTHNYRGRNIGRVAK